MVFANAAGRDAWIEETCETIRAQRPPGGKIVFVSGNFNIVHHGHLRLLNFAADCGEMLVVGVNTDTLALSLMAEPLRLEAVRSIGIVDFAFILQVPPEALIRVLRPDIVVKGKEHEGGFNPEGEAVESYGGKLLFSSGETRFSSLDLLQRELRETNYGTILKPMDYPARHGFAPADLVALLPGFARLRVAVIGDLIVDEYISCEALGMSQEDPTLVVSPIKSDRFVGGAGIVAAHARGLGATVSYFGIAGCDEVATYATDTLRGYGVDAVCLVDDSRPTTLKQRYRASGKTLLRVSHLRQHDIAAELAARLFEQVTTSCPNPDVLIFADFNYGCLPQGLIERLTEFYAAKGTMMVADSQASSQMSDVSRFGGMKLLTPTEREARLAVRDPRSGLVVLAEALRRQAAAEFVLITLGPEGLLIHAPQDGSPIFTDRLPAFNSAPKDVAGAGDSLLTCTALALACGIDIWRGAYLGSVAAACQVGRTGNSPLSVAELTTELLL